MTEDDQSELEELLDAMEDLDDNYSIVFTIIKAHRNENLFNLQDISAGSYQKQGSKYITIDPDGFNTFNEAILFIKGIVTGFEYEENIKKQYADEEI